MKRPENLLDTPPDEPRRQQAFRQPSAWPQPSDTEREAESQEQGAEYGDFVEQLAGSIIRRNAQARKGPAGHVRQQARSRKALGRVLQGILGE